MPFERIEPSSQLSDLAKMVCAVQLPVTRGHGGKKKSSQIKFFQNNSVFLYYIAPVILIFGHHFRDLLIPTFIVVTILLLIINISFNHILLCLASFDLYCGSFAVYKGCSFGCVSSCTGHTTHFTDTALFSYFMSGSSHFARASNDKYSVEFWIFVIVMFFNHRQVLKFWAPSRYYKGS